MPNRSSGMFMMNDPLSIIRNYYRISENLATAGQPTEGQFSIIRDEGFDVVINLAMADSPRALPDEAALLESLDLEYIHIPVNFAAPEINDLLRFNEAMHQNKNKKCFVHCALNWRVSAFIFLYRTLTGGMQPEEAMHDLQAVWQPDATWQAFIDAALEKKFE